MKAKLIVSALLTAGMMLSMTACGGAASSTALASESSPEQDRFKENMEISIASWSIGDAITDGEDPVRDNLYEKLNITIKPYPVTWGDYMEKIQVWSASHRLPDITAVDVEFTDTFNKWVSQGVVSPLPDDLSAYPNLERMLSLPEAQAWRAKDGKFYCVPKANYPNGEYGILEQGIVLRKDWMEAVGVTKVPETNEELIDLLTKFQTMDPDGNGKDDTIGLTMYNLGLLSGLFVNTEPGALMHHRFVYDKDGKWIPSFMSENFYNGLTEMRALFDAGVVDPDFAILKGEEGRDKFKNGRAGAYAHNVDPFALKNLADHFATVYPDKKFSDIIVIMMPFKHADGSYYYKAADVFYAGLYLRGDMDEEKMDRCLALLDYLYSEEAYREINCGIEGVDYNLVDGKIEMIPQKAADGSELTILQKYPASRLGSLTYWSTYRAMEDPRITDDIREMAQERLDWVKEVGAKEYKMPDARGLQYESQNKNTGMAPASLIKDLNTLMVSPDLKTAYDQMVNDYLKNGYADIIEEVNAAAEAEGRK